MAENKKQHYVPKFYLRLFSILEEGVFIKIFVKETQKIIHKGAIKNQAYENYLYGKNSEIESCFSDIEGKVSKIISKIKNDRELPKKDSEEYVNLWLFILLQAYRTKGKADELNEMIDKSLKKLMKYEEQFKDYNFDEFTFGYEDPTLYNLDILVKSLPMMADLEMKLIINSSEVHFITSDNPVFKYNQFLEKRKHPFSHTGMASKGLQIFYPITPYYYILLYDPKVYKVGFKKRNIVEVNSKWDIDSLNLLQYLNSNKVVFSNENISDFYFETLSEKSEKYKDQGKLKINEYPEETNEDGTTSILMHQNKENFQMNLNLSFIKATPHAKHYKMTGFVAEIRNEYYRKRENRSR